MIDKKTLQDIKDAHDKLWKVLVSFIEIYSGDDKYCSRYFTGTECPYLDGDNMKCEFGDEPEKLDSEWYEIEECVMFVRSRRCRFKR